jgi:hypothetical protein
MTGDIDLDIEEKVNALIRLADLDTEHGLLSPALLNELIDDPATAEDIRVRLIEQRARRGIRPSSAA